MLGALFINSYRWIWPVPANLLALGGVVLLAVSLLYLGKKPVVWLAAVMAIPCLFITVRTYWGLFGDTAVVHCRQGDRIACDYITGRESRCRRAARWEYYLSCGHDADQTPRSQPTAIRRP
jgi:hypothetical protein